MTMNFTSRISATPVSVLVLLLLACLAAPPLLAQKVIQLERYGSTKTRKYYIGDELTFSMQAAPRQFYTQTILDIYPDVQTILFEGGQVPAGEIVRLGFPGSRDWVRGLGRKLLVFTGGWVLYSGLDALINQRQPAPFQYQVGLGALGLSGPLMVVPDKQWRLGERRRIRLLDLTFYPTAPLAPAP